LDIWITKCRRTSKCKHCAKQILNKDFMVMGKSWKRIHFGGEVVPKMFVTVYRWHLQCWVEQGVAAVKERGDKPETRGRRKIPMTDEVLAKRTSILRRRAAVLQRIRKEISGKNRMDKIIHLGGMLESLTEEIVPVGGVPSSW